MKNKIISAALFGAIAVPLLAFAETPMELVIVTPSRFVSSPGSSTVDVTVITASDIEKSAASTLPALLSQYTRIQIRSNDGTPDMAIDLRGFGMSGNQNTLVLLDGQPLNEIQLTAIRWSSIPLESIDRIEIMNGSGAVLYGGGATGGTINIITKHPAKEKNGNIGIGFASYDTKEWQLAFTGSEDRVGMRVTASGKNSSNYRDNNNISQKNLEADLHGDMEHGQAIIKFGLDTQDLRYPGPRTVDSSIGVNELATDPRGTASPLDYGKREGGHVSLGTSQLFDLGRLAGELSYRETKQKAFFAAYGGNYLDTNLDLLSFTPRINVPFQISGKDNEFVTGLDLADWNYDSRRSNDPSTISTPTVQILAKQSNRALYAQNTTQLDPGTKLTLGGRLQRVDYQVRDVANPEAYASSKQGHSVHAYELGIRHQMNSGISLFGRIGSSFRIATVDEVFDQYGGPIFDSIVTILEPQTSHDSEVGFDYKSGSNNLRVALYQMNLYNEIHYNAITYTNMNLSPTHRYGMELEGSHHYSDAIEFAAAYSYTVAKFREGVYGGLNISGNDIPLVPRQRLALSGSWRATDKSVLNMNAVYIGKQHFDNDQTDTFGQLMPAYTVVDTKLTYHEGSWKVSAAVNNIFNRQYFTYGVASTSTVGRYNAYPMQERNYSLSANYEF